MIQLGTKAETLSRIYNKLNCASVFPQISFTVMEWQSCPKRYWQQCVKEWGERKVIVRSSAVSEDTQDSSQAGRFESIGNVDLSNGLAFENAVFEVIDSYTDDDQNNQVLVQPMLDHVKICGVAFTLDPNSLGNYYVINYDESGSTSAITSGSGQNNKLHYVFKGKGIKNESDYISRLCMTLRELEGLFGQNNLDVEFAVTDKGELYIFQVRALCIQGQAADLEDQCDVLQRIRTRFRQLSTRCGM